MKKLLLHVCCAPCSTSVIEILQEEFQISVFFYNPNIHPEAEYLIRLNEVRRYSGIQDTPLIESDYMPDDWFKAIKGTESATEKSGIRCEKCIRIRMDKMASIAEEKAFDFFTTTLSVSPHKNIKQIHEIGHNLESLYGVKYYAGDFKKKDGYKRSIEMSREFDLYRQNYCGCVYSKQI